MTNKKNGRAFTLLAVAFMFFVSGCAQGNATPAPTTIIADAAVPTESPATSSSPQKTPEPASAPAPTSTPGSFTAETVPQEVRERMMGKSYPEDCPIPFEELRYLRLLHTGFDGETHEGEMVVNKKIADDVLEIFEKLYEAGYPLERITLIDDYDAVDEASMTDNNTSSFCYRTISGTTKLSYHARGLAVDVNPLYNPFISPERIEPKAGEKYATDRDTGNPYFIDEEDLCYRLFTEHGFFWGGHFEGRKDYQHFQMSDE